MGSISLNGVEAIWLGIGFLGQALFTSRFLIQWLASERERDSVVPTAFWWLSLAGGLTLLSYAIYKKDPVIIVGQSTGIFIYVRNLYLSSLARQRAQAKAHPNGPQAMLPPPLPKPHLAAVSERKEQPVAHRERSG